MFQRGVADVDFHVWVQLSCFIILISLKYFILLHLQIFFFFLSSHVPNGSTPICVHPQPRKSVVSWAASKWVWPGGQGRWFSPSILLSWDPTWSAMYIYGVPSLRSWNCSGARPEGHKADKRTGAPPPWRESEKFGAVQSGEGCV